MPTLTLKTEEGERPYEFTVGHSVRYLLDATDVQVRSGCRGTGGCGLCLVRVHAGEAGEPKLAEHLNLDEDQLAQGVRLACQIVPMDDMTVEVLARAPLSAWRFLEHENGLRPMRLERFPGHTLQPPVSVPYGVAIDLGTTHISVSVYHLSSGNWLAGRRGQNTQAAYGADVITRLAAAVESPAQADAMRKTVLDAIGDALWDISTREGIILDQVVRLTLVGNTAMLSLLSGRNFHLLLQPSQWMSAIDCQPTDTAAWARSWRIHPQAQIDIIPPLAGFVGSDLLAGVVATNLIAASGGMLIDFGTNSEIALWDGKTLWCTSAAGGPAFEGTGIRHGMPAETGAIYRINFREDGFGYAVIGDVEAQGICGSGLVDLIAGLIDSGNLSAVGKFAPGVPSGGFVLAHGARTINFSLGDVDTFQRAKAAIGVGIQVLLEYAGMSYDDLQRICVGGAFGHALNVCKAQRIGLLPPIAPARVELGGNTALAGSEEALLSPSVLQEMRQISKQAKIINLSSYSNFDMLYMENLFLHPMHREQM